MQRNTKVAIITDQHFGARNDSPVFLDFYEKFYNDVFFPTLEKEKIKTVLVLGDTFDRRKYLNFYTLKRAKEMFFNKLAMMGIEAHILAGNHDTYFKNTNDVNSVDLLLGEYGILFNVIDHPTHIYVGPHKVCMMPWICPENYDDSMETIKDSDAKYCMGHFEIEGFAMYRGMHSEEGLDRGTFRKFARTFSGHYHHKSNADGIHYLGNPYQLTWQDYGDERGFHIFDLDTDTLDFVANPYTIFHRVTYDDKAETIKQIDEKDLSIYKNCYIKVVVINKTNPYLFDKFMNNLYNVNPADITIVEDFTELTEGVEDDMVNQAEDTLTILNKFVDSVQEDNIDNNKLKTLLKELYLEALNAE
jgi:DNA repair exonuclease SbcCD nuclease subunit